MRLLRVSHRWLPVLLVVGLVWRCGPPKESPKRPPNVILVMTDDQGIGDLGAHDNPWIQTPNIDRFYEESVRLTNFHVSPLCTPTRSALMTGLYPINNGVWATFKGRDMLHPTTPTMAEIFRDNGYATALFGKWHLGNNYPARPTDRGFDHAVHHSSGGVGELSDYWGNNYFDDTYLVNNEPQAFEGYCTDVWFDQAIAYMEAQREEPFFIYLPTNAPHHPLYVDDSYRKPYDSLVGTSIPNASFYGMITNIDDNFGRLVQALNRLELADNTILIFCSDNGSQFGVSPDYSLGWNKGFRGRKADKLEAGHRVPFFVRWPDAGVTGGKDVDDLTAHVDLIPTLAGLCGFDLPANFDGDGIDASETILTGSALPTRTVFVHHRQDYRPPLDVEGSCLMRDRWRLINGNELYDIAADPLQLKNIADQHPDIVTTLLAENEAFVAKANQRPEYQSLAYHEVGHEEQTEIKLTIQHALGEDGGIWKSEQVAAGLKNRNASHPVRFLESGTYRISCQRWPKECPGPVLGIPGRNPKEQFEYETMTPDRAIIKLFDQVYEKPIVSSEEAVVFEVEIEAGETLLETWFGKGDEKYGVYYTYVEFTPSP